MNKSLLCFAASLFILLPVSSVHLQEELDFHTIEALLKTQALLNNKIKREQSIKNNPRGQSADQRVKSLSADPDITEEIYKLTADVFGTLVKETQGDPKKMTDLLNKAEKSPEEFSKLFTPEQIEKIRELGKKIEKSKPAS